MEPKPPVAPETITLNVTTYNELRDKNETFQKTIQEKERQLLMIHGMVDDFNTKGDGRLEFDFKKKEIRLIK